MTDNSQYPAKKELERRQSSAKAKRPATERRVMSAPVQRLAERLGVDPDALKLDPDTVRRTQYPVKEIENEDGTVTYEEDLGITEGPRALHHK